MPFDDSTPRGGDDGGGAGHRFRLPRGVAAGERVYIEHPDFVAWFAAAAALEAGTLVIVSQAGPYVVVMYLAGHASILDFATIEWRLP